MTPARRDPRFPESLHEFRLLQRLRFSLLRNSARQLFRDSRIRLISILLCSLLVAGSLFFGSYEGFAFLQRQNIPFSGRIVGTLFDFLFLALGMLLVFSGGIILFSSLFSTSETAFLLSAPMRADQIFAFKFQSAITFSSWAFLLLGMPILLSYGLVFSVPAYYYLLLPVFFVSFLLIPGSIGAIFGLLIVNVTPQRRKQVLAGVIIAMILAALAWTAQTIQEVRQPRSNRDALQWLDARFAFTRSAFMPSHWMTRGLQASARGDLPGAAYSLTLLVANGAFLYLLAAWVASRLYRRGYNRLATGGSLRKRYGHLWIDSLADHALRFVDPQTRLLIIKDFRNFRRDPAQWAQILIFCGLIVLYLVNSPQFYQSDRGRSFQHLISFTNLVATAMLMCAYMSRFVFPMLSLEGKKFWILGLLPLQRDRLLWGKFLFAATGGMIVGLLLVTMSDLLLGMPLVTLAIHLPTVVVLAAGLSGLSVGLGTIMPNFRESDPSRIAVGFGGTMNLIAGLLFLLVIIATMVGPYHLMAGLSQEGFISRGGWIGIATGVGIGVVIGVLVTRLPLRAAARVLNTMEF